MSQCTYRCVVLPDMPIRGLLSGRAQSLNAPTGAWCSLTAAVQSFLPFINNVSMHLQVRGAP